MTGRANAVAGPSSGAGGCSRKPFRFFRTPDNLATTPRKSTIVKVTGKSHIFILTTSLELDCVAEEEDTGPDEEFEECLLRDSEVLLLHFPRASFSSDRLLLH